jgi:uncharacterized protein (TIGR03083 family)
MVVSTDQAATRGALERVGGQVAELVRSLSDTSRRIPGSEWTVGDAAAHLVVVFTVYGAAVEGSQAEWTQPYVDAGGATRDRLASGSSRTVLELPRHDAGALSGLLAERLEAFLAAIATRSAHEVVSTPWYGPGITRNLATLTGVGLGELVVHGYDMARAVGKPWPIEACDARLVLSAAAAMLPLFVDANKARGVTASYKIHIRGGPSLVVRIVEGTARVEPSSSSPVDCHLSVDPLAFLLVGYGRIGQWGPIAKGQLVAWGRKPWLGLKFKNLFLNP